LNLLEDLGSENKGLEAAELARLRQLLQARDEK